MGAVLAALVVCTLHTPLRAQTSPTGWASVRVDDGDGPVSAVDVSLVSGDRVVVRGETGAAGRVVVAAPAGGYTVRAVRLGYAAESRAITLVAGDTVRVELTLRPQAIDLEGIGVEAERSRSRRRFEETAGVTVRELSRDEVKLVPGFGEADPIRAVEVLPGVVSTSDFSSSFNVRGGSADQNLILLDGVPIFSPFHLGGLFSVFNADMVERAELFSGGFSARYGGRVSSVLAVESDPGDGAFGVDAGVSLLATRVAVEGGAPEAVRDGLGLSDLRWRVSGRRSYVDVLLAPFADVPYHLQDLQAVVEAGVGRRDRVRVTAYTGDDVLDLASIDDEDFPLRVDWNWGNDVVGMRWSRELERGTWTTTASLTRYGTGLSFPDFGDTQFRSRVNQDAVRSEIDVRVAPRLRLSGGVGLEALGYDNLARSGGTVFQEGRGDGRLYGGFGQAELGSPGDWLVELGARVDHWRPDPGEPVTVLSPRLAAKAFFAGSRWALKASVGRYTQFLHSLRDEELPLGLDIWVLSGSRAPHVVSDQLQVGVEAFPDETWNFSLEAYLRDFDGVVTFNPADDPNDPLDDILAGTGRSWGADLFVRRSGTPVSGWIALSFLRAERTFPDFLSPEPDPPPVTFAPIFDRRVDLDVVLQLPGFWGWRTGLRLNVGSGTPYTRPVASYAAYQPRFLPDGARLEWAGADESGDGFGGYAVLLGERNAERYPVYHRLDVSFRKEIERSWGTLTPHIDILNLYNRRNVLFYFFDYAASPATRSGISMFPVLPTVGLEVRF